MTKVENGTKNFDQKSANKRKIAKELNVDKNTASALTSNALDAGDTKEDNAIDRPRKKNGRKKIKKQKKLRPKSDGFFCGAPSECFR